MSKGDYFPEKYEKTTTYKNKDYTLSELYSKYQNYKSTLCKWIENFEDGEVRDLEVSKTWKKYFKELKESAVRDYIFRRVSLRGAVKNIT